MAALDPFVSFPLLGNCSNRQACAPAPWGNTILGNAAVNASVANVNLPAPAEFPTARPDLMLVNLMATLLRPTLRFLRTPQLPPDLARCQVAMETIENRD